MQTLTKEVEWRDMTSLSLTLKIVMQRKYNLQLNDVKLAMITKMLLFLINKNRKKYNK